MCEKEGLDPSIVKNRAAMSSKVTAESREAWATEANNPSSPGSSVLSEETVTTGDTPTTPNDLLEEPSDPKAAMLFNTLEIDAVDIALVQDDVMYQDTTFHASESRELFTDSCLPPGSVDPDALQFVDMEDTTPISSSKDALPKAPSPLHIDPRLFTGEIDFEGLAEIDSSETPTAAVEEAYFDDIVSQTVPKMISELLIDGVDFVRFFSKINVSTNQVLAQKGYHKDQLALARSFYNSFYGAVLEHQRTCKILSREAFTELSKAKPFPCDRSGYFHEWKPRSCGKEDCDLKVLFDSYKELKKHMEKSQSPYTPSRCQFPGCSSKVEYATAMTYRHHLGTHGLNDRKEKDKYMPGKKAAFVPQKCQVPGCIIIVTHTRPGSLRDHLAKKHDYQEDEIEEYLSIHRD
ncbi:hypothetical protein BKA65DRAFT_532107 [Rhexocercosporidium sp. MPI-PUGE-AT-0058]|nr:hypothetical protein BKA65DRAFT_532107 [Rhexocercosporidium sp. MPI-PUGE-AT-0058]